MARQNEENYTLDIWKGAGGITHAIGLKINGQKTVNGKNYCVLYDPNSDEADQKAISQFCQENKFPLDVNKFEQHWILLRTELQRYRRSMQFQHILLKYIIGGGVQKRKYTLKEEEIFGLSNDHDDNIIDMYEEKLNPPVVSAKVWFRREKWAEIQKQNPNTGLLHRLKILNEQWDTLEDKSKYIELEKKDEIRFKTNFKS